MSARHEVAARFPHLYSPLELRGRVLRNRIVSTPHATGWGHGSIALWDERNEPALRALAEGVHSHGALCMSQLTHMGRRGTSTLTGIPLRAPERRSERCPR